MVLWLYMAGCLLGGVGLGVLLGIFGGAIPWQSLPVHRTVAVLIVTGAVGLIYSVRELNLADIPAPQSRWQVPQSWFYLFPLKLSILFYGLGLGFGLATRIPISTFYVVVLWAMLTGNPLISAFGMATFGFGRALPLLWMGRLPGKNEEHFHLTEALFCWKPAVQLVNGLTLAVVGSCLMTAGLILEG